jgi:hypothetical protein
MRLPPLPDDDLRLPDLRAWVAFFGGYDKITTEAWAHWDGLCEAYRKMQRLDGREARVP